MRHVLVLALLLVAAPLGAVPLPADVGLSASDAVGEERDGTALPPALDLKAITVKESGESAITLTIETAGSLAAPEAGSFKKLSYVFSLDIDNDGFTGTDWGADFSVILSYDVASAKWSCDFARHSEAYSQRMRIIPKVAPAKDNTIAVEVTSALFQEAKGGVWSMETKGDEEVADVIPADRQKPARIVAGDSQAYDSPARQEIFFDNLPPGASLSRSFAVPDKFAVIKCRLHLRALRPGEGSAPEVTFFFGAKLVPGQPFFGLAAKDGKPVARIGLGEAAKTAPVALGSDLSLRLERKGSWLAFFVGDQLVGSLNAKGLISDATLLTMKVTGADLRADQFVFTAEAAEKPAE